MDEKESSDQRNSKDITGVTYYIEVKYNGTEDYRIRVPIAVDGNGFVLAVAENLSVIAGNGTYFSSNSAKGFCLEIRGNESLTLMGTDQITCKKTDMPSLTLGENLTIASRDYPCEKNFTFYVDNITDSNYVSVHVQLDTHYGSQDVNYKQIIRALLTSPVGEKQFKGYLKIAVA